MPRLSLICHLPWFKRTGYFKNAEATGHKDKVSSISGHGGTFNIGTSVYAVAPTPCRLLPVSRLDKLRKKSTRRSLATVFLVPASDKGANETVTLDWITNAVENYTASDGVFHISFLETVIFKGGGKKKPRISPKAQKYLFEQGTRDIILWSDAVDLPPGPYYKTGNQMRDVWKLEDDTYGTCMVTVAPKSE